MLNKLLTEVLTIADLKALYAETFLNHTSKISKISDLSVLNAHTFGVAKVFQKDLKDTAIIESQIFPELSSGTYLDNSAKLVGSIARLTAAGSSTFVLVYADPATIYIPGESSFVSNQGVTFNITDVIVVGDNGYAYVPVRSASVGVNTNVNAFSINRVLNAPLGHISCTNEYEATGGRDNENDEDFKSRISQYQQFATKSSHENLLMNLQDLDPDILNIKRAGYTEDGKILISIVTCNGKAFTQDELSAFENNLSTFMAMSDVDDQAGVLGIKLQNIEWQQVGGANGVDFRIDILSGFTEVDVRKNIQIQLTKYFDFRFFQKDRIEWDDLLQIVKSVKGVKYIPDEFFLPNTDSAVEKYKLPRIIKFVMRDMSGDILYNNSSAILPIYYSV
jgi:hypothetical protein